MEKIDTGIELLKQRIDEIPKNIIKMLAKPIKTKLPVSAEHFIVTGTGCSEAHAKFFVSLINEYTPRRAFFSPLSAFYNPIKEQKNSILVVFSQGLSPNAIMAVNQGDRFAHTILFTSTTLEGTVKSGKNIRINTMKKLLENKQTIVHFPIENEYGIFLRVIGPMAGYLAAIQFIESVWPKVIPACEQSLLLTELEEAILRIPVSVPTSYTETLRHGSLILAISPISQYAQNLSHKILEGLFFQAPKIIDYFSFAHGPFQILMKHSRPIFIFCGNTPAEEKLYEKSRNLISHTPSLVWKVSTQLPQPWSILGFEAMMNAFLVKALEVHPVNQKEWPGKDLDGSMYDIHEPLY